MTSDQLSESLLISSMTVFRSLCAASMPPSNTTPIAEKRHELSSGTTRNVRCPASLPGSATESPIGLVPLPAAAVLTAGDGAGGAAGAAGVARGEGADSCAFSVLTDGGGVGTGAGADVGE